MDTKVLILDANQRSALAAARSLGKRGIHVTVGGETRRTLAGSSRYCRDTMVYPVPDFDPEGFVMTLSEEVVKRKIEMIFPMTDVTAYLVLKNREKFSEAVIPSPPFGKFEMLTNKWELYHLAKELEISTPLTALVTSLENLSRHIGEIKLPAVVKPYRSRVLSNGKWVGHPTTYLRSANDIERLMQGNSYVTTNPFLIQEYISGDGQGIFTLYDRGRLVSLFAHKRVREKPPSGGVSVVSESVEPNPRMVAFTERLLNRLEWHGVAMVEFKVAHDGTPYLIEINPRFWGSLQLAIDAGVDFPWLLVQVGMGRTVDTTNEYRIGIRNRWLLGDLDHLYLCLKSEGSLGEKQRALADFLHFFDANTNYEVNRWDDLRPCLFEMIKYCRELGKCTVVRN